MPFTLTHVLAVAPLWRLRKFLPFSALAIGSMVPDLPIFFPFVHYGLTHSTIGAITVCLPLGLSLFLLFEFVMRRPLTELLPKWIRIRLPAENLIPLVRKFQPVFRFFVGVALAIVIGALTHQVWDAFSHQDRWGIRLIPQLDSRYDIGGYAVPGYKIVQYGCSLIGLPVLALAAAIVLLRTAPDPDRRTLLRTHLRFLVGALVFTIPFIVGTFVFTTATSSYVALGVTIKYSGAILFVGLLLYCILFNALVGRGAVCGK